MPIHKTFQYVPIKQVMKLILQSPGYIESIMQCNVSENGMLRDFVDRSYCKRSALLSSKFTVNILLFIDDAEITNPLSENAGSHKLGMIYFSIKIFPRNCNHH